MTPPPSVPDDPSGHLAVPNAEISECFEQVGVNLLEHEPLPPEPPAGAPVAERDAYWRKHVYLGDRQAQFTWRAVAVGGVFGMFLSLCSLYITLQIGWGLGLVLLAVLGTYSGSRLLAGLSSSAGVWMGLRVLATCAVGGVFFLLWSKLARPEIHNPWFLVLGGALALATGVFWPKRFREFTMLENAAMSSVASTASSTTGMCVVAAFGGLLIVQGTHPDWRALAGVLAFNGVLGVSLAILFKRRMINEEDLPYPSPKAGAVMLKGLYADGREGLVQSRALFATLATGGLVGLFRSWSEMAAKFAAAQEALKAKAANLPWVDAGREFLDRMSRWSIPAELPFSGAWLPLAAQRVGVAGLAFEPSLMLTSVGMIVGLRVALSMLLGSIILNFVLAPAMWHADQAFLAAHGAVEGFKPAMPVHGDMIVPLKWSLWGGTALMVMASFTTLALQAPSLARSFRTMLSAKGAAHDPVADVEIPISWAALLGVPAAAGLIWAQWWGFGVNPLLGLAAVSISFGVAVVCSRAAAEADVNPIGAMGKVSQLVFAFLPGAKGDAAINLLSAGSTSSAGGASADQLGDHKASRLIGANPRGVLYAQLTGILFGVVSVIPAWFLLVPNRETLETRYPAVPAKMWSAVAKLLTEKSPSLPHGAVTLMLVCAALGVAIPLLGHRFPKVGRWLPSTMGLGLSLTLPFSNALSFAIGAIIMVVWERGHKKSAVTFALIFASGLMSGQALVESFMLLGGEAVKLLAGA